MFCSSPCWLSPELLFQPLTGVPAPPYPHTVTQLLLCFPPAPFLFLCLIHLIHLMSLQIILQWIPITTRLKFMFLSRPRRHMRSSPSTFLQASLSLCSSLPWASLLFPVLSVLPLRCSAGSLPPLPWLPLMSGTAQCRCRTAAVCSKPAFPECSCAVCPQLL